MKTLFRLCLLLFVLAGSKAAAHPLVPPAHHPLAPTRLPGVQFTPDSDEEQLNSQTIQITNYLSAALRLTRIQTDSLREHTRRHLQLLQARAAIPDSAALRPLPNLGSAEQIGPYHRALRDILSAEQYQRLLALEARQGRQPVMELIASLR